MRIAVVVTYNTYEGSRMVSNDLATIIVESELVPTRGDYVRVDGYRKPFEVYAVEYNINPQRGELSSVRILVSND